MPPATPTRRDLRPLLFHFPPSEPSAALFSPAKGAGGASSACSQHGALPSPGSPSPRWRHAMCLSDPAMAVLVGGEGVDQRSCKDTLWKLEVGKEFGAVRGNGMLMGGWESRMTWVGGCPLGSVRRQVLGGFVLLVSHSAGACIPYHLSGTVSLCHTHPLLLFYISAFIPFFTDVPCPWASTGAAGG